MSRRADIGHKGLWAWLGLVIAAGVYIGFQRAHIGVARPVVGRTGAAADCYLLCEALCRDARATPGTIPASRQQP